MSQRVKQSEQYERVDAIRKEVENELLKRPNISHKDVESFRFSTHRPKDGIVFDYPGHHYIESRDELAAHADLIEGLVQERVDILDRWDVTTRTNGQPNRHYWVIPHA